MTWRSTYTTNLKGSFSQEKYAMGIILNKGKFEHTVIPV